jgi:hypothetical protein
MKKGDIKNEHLYWYVYKNDLKTDIELLTVMPSIYGDDIDFRVVLEADGSSFETVEIQLEQTDDEYIDLFEYDDKFTAEMKWFELFFKNFQSVSGMDIARFIELYKYAEEHRPDLIFKGM